MYLVHLVEAVENLAQVGLADTLARILHAEGEPRRLAGAGENDLSVGRCVLEGVGHEVEENALYHLGIDGEGKVCGKANVEHQLDVALAG